MKKLLLSAMTFTALAVAPALAADLPGTHDGRMVLVVATGRKLSRGAWRRDVGMRTTTPKPKRTTARNIELYSSAYRNAWKHISALQKREQPDISLPLHASIRRQLKKGAMLASVSPADVGRYSTS
jgi:hypothetical protein